MLAADQYRQSASTQQQVSKEVTRLEHEIAGLEAELDKLRLEREQFPDASAVAFFKKVLGVRP